MKTEELNQELENETRDKNIQEINKILNNLLEDETIKEQAKQQCRLSVATMELQVLEKKHKDKNQKIENYSFNKKLKKHLKKTKKEIEKKSV